MAGDQLGTETEASQRAALNPAVESESEHSQTPEMASGTGRPSNPSFVASFPCLPFDVWRSCHYQSLHWLVVVMCFGIGLHPVVGGPSSSQSSVPFSLFAGGLLVLGARKTERSSRPGYWLKLMSIFCAVVVFVRLSKDQMDGASRFDVPPARMLLEFGMDIIRPYLFAISVPAFGMTAWLYVPVLFAYSVSLYISSTYLIMNLHTLGQNEGAKAVLEDVSREECFICIVLSMVLFLATTVSVVYNERQTIHVYNSMEQRMHAQSQEAAATQRAIQSELRAKEAERLSNEQALQMRNKYLGAMCHDFGTPMSVLQMLLSVLRRRLRKNGQHSASGRGRSGTQHARAGGAAAGAGGERSQHRRDERSSGDDNGGLQQLAVSGGERSGAALERTVEESSGERCDVYDQGSVRGHGRTRSRAVASSRSSHPAAADCNLDDNAFLFDLIRRASAALELLEVTRQKAIAYSKLETGSELEPLIKKFNVADLVHMVASIARDTGKSNDVEVRYVVAPGTPLVMKSDGRWLFMVLVNLASNAMKHTSDGSVTLTVSLTPSGKLSMEVRDTGKGVPAWFAPSLFQPFSSANGANSCVESTGLGLYHSKQLVMRLGGDIGYASNAPRGSVFFVEVPFVPAEDVDDSDGTSNEGSSNSAARADHAAATGLRHSWRGNVVTHAAPATAAPNAIGATPTDNLYSSLCPSVANPSHSNVTARARLRSVDMPEAHGVVLPSPLLLNEPVLVVDKVAYTRDALIMRLRRLTGAVAFCAFDGREAIEMLATPTPRRRRPTLVFVSAQALGGVQTAAQLRRWERQQRVASSERLRIVGLLSGTRDSRLHRACLDAGMDDVLLNSFTNAQLHAVLHKFSAGGCAPLQS